MAYSQGSYQAEINSPSKPVYTKASGLPLASRVKELISYTDKPEEIDVLVEAYKKILELNKVHSF